MASEDFAILRELFRDSTLWTGNVDPHAPRTDLAHRVGVVRSTVWTRLRKLERAGVLGGYFVMPNPGLFEHLMGPGRVRVDQSNAKLAFLENLPRLPGVVGALDYVGPWVQVNVVGPTPASFKRWRTLFESAPGVEDVIGFEPYLIPTCSAAPSLLDWRLIETLTREDRPTLDGASRELRLANRTLSRHHDRLVKGHAFWYVPSIDYASLVGTAFGFFNVFLTAGELRSAIIHQISEAFPDYIELSDDSRFSVPDQGRRQDLYAVIPFGSPGRAEDAQRRILAFDGVREVELLFPRRTHCYFNWFHEQTLIEIKRRRSRSLP